MENKILNDKLFEAFASSSDNVYVYVTDLQNGLSRWSKNSVEYFNFPDEYMTNVLSILKTRKDISQIWQKCLQESATGTVISIVLKIVTANMYG